VRVSGEAYNKVSNNNLISSIDVASGRNAIVSPDQITAETSHLQTATCARF
jgi:hypothetical protein